MSEPRDARIKELETSLALQSIEIDKMDTTILAQRERIAQLEEMLGVAKDALIMIEMRSPQLLEGCAYIEAREALAKIEAMRGGK